VFVLVVELNWNLKTSSALNVVLSKFQQSPLLQINHNHLFVLVVELNWNLKTSSALNVVLSKFQQSPLSRTNRHLCKENITFLKKRVELELCEYYW